MSATMRQMNTDRRLGLLILGGDTLLRAVDPQGIASQARVSRLQLERTGKEKPVQWNIDAVFPNGDGFRAVGESSDEDTVICELLIPVDGSLTKVSGKPGKTLQDVLGALDGVPARLKRNLSPTAPKGGIKEEPGGDTRKVIAKTYFDVALDALCYKTEGGDITENRMLFREVKAVFARRLAEAATSVELTAVSELKDGKIRLTAKADVYGLARKRCTLQKELGLGHRVDADCTAKKKGTAIPSIRVALDLYGAIPVLYGDQMIERIGKGPRLPGMK